MWARGFSVYGKWEEQQEKFKVLKMAHGERWQLTTELLPPKGIDLLDLVGPQLKKPSFM